MPVSFPGLFSQLPAAVASLLEDNAELLGLQRVTVGTIGDGFRFPEAYVAFPDDDALRAEPDPATGRPGSRWLVPVSVVLLTQYKSPRSPEGEDAPLTQAVAHAEAVGGLILSNPGMGQARGVRFVSMAVEEGVGDAKLPTFGIDLRFVYEVVLSRA